MQRLKTETPPDRWQAGGGVEGGKTSYSRGNYTTSQPPVHALLDRLDKVKRTGDGRWLACCPAHGDRTPSLSVRETSDGTVLVHCFAGCGAADVMAAVGLELSDLFPDRGTERGPMRPGQRWMPKDVLSAVAHEAVVALVAAETVHCGQTLGDDDMTRLATAVARLRAAAREVGCNV